MDNVIWFTKHEPYLGKPQKKPKDPLRAEVCTMGKVNSPILNSGSLLPGSIYMPMLADRKYLTGLKCELLGNEKGEYYRNGFLQTSAIPALINRLTELDEKIANHRLQRRNQGYAESDALPQELSEERSKLLGTLDCRMLELKDIDRRLKVFEDREKSVEDARVLAYGLQMSGRLRGGILAEIDGMTVGRTAEGILIINDERSPYNGMSVPDYRLMAARWQQERGEADKQKLLALQKEAKKMGRYVPMQLPVTGSRKVARATLPGFPAWATNYLTLNKVENDSIKNT